MNLPVTPPKSAVPLDPRTYARGLSCVHCGLCLPVCPTYTQNFNEADSPRGRIQLMLALADGEIQPTHATRRHLDLCLDCRACETACPSGVVYHELIEETRMHLAPTSSPSISGRLMRWFFMNVMTRPTRLKLALLPARLLQRVGVYSLLRKIGLFRLLPLQFRKMEQMLPTTGEIWPRPLPEESPAHGTATKNVAFFSGCIGSVMTPTTNRQAVDLLNACGATVRSCANEHCCGAIHHHNGDHHHAAELARQNIDALLPVANEPAMIVSTIAGCGAMLRDYPTLLRDDPDYRERSIQFAARVRDISEALVELGLPELKHTVDKTVTYHDACHLAHAQKVTAAPRTLLAKIPGLKMVPLPESDMCCGAAGTYNLTEPEMAGALGERKVRNIVSTKASTCVSGNVGCSMQIQSIADATNQPLKVVHPVSLLHESLFGPCKTDQR